MELEKYDLKEGHGENSENQPPPEDRYHIVSIIFALFGLGGWTAWNASVAGIDFFNSRFQPKYDPSFTFGFVFTWPLFLGNFALLYLADKVPLWVKINISFIMIMV